MTRTATRDGQRRLGELKARGLEEHRKNPRSLRSAKVIGSEIRVEIVEGRGSGDDPLRVVVYWFGFNGRLSRAVERKGDR